MRRKILIVDDVRTNRLILSGMLERDYDILEAADGEEALARLEQDHASLSAVLLDISMPGIDGFEVLRRIRLGAFSQMPVIMITGSDDETSRIKALTLGANDYVMKPYSLEIIRHCLYNNIALREAAETLDIVEKDRLTGVWTREAFFRRAAALIDRQEPGYYILGCLDIEGFKILNDQYGVETGDRVLEQLGAALLDSCRRYGGLCGRVFADQFVSLYPRTLPDTAPIDPARLADWIKEHCGTQITISVGRYLITDKSLSVSAMFDRAAIAKSTVKGRYDTHIAVYDEDMRSPIVYEQTLVREMNSALAGRQFEVWFQPQYNHATQARIGAEALVRWRHPEKGLIAPDSFIPIFERNGFIYSLDKFVWQEACACLRRWLDQGLSPLPVSVNLSRYDILRPDLLETITGLLAKYDLPRELLRLEITESAFTKSSQPIVETVRALVSSGFTVEIDDFGSGYSSLNILKDVPAQVIKLDMKFLASSQDSQRGGNIVESVVRMAKWLGMSVIAEGVEIIEQADYLLSIGCSYMQGYLFYKPLPLADYEAQCLGGGREERLLTLETVQNLDNNAFWDPQSMDTLIFNSYVGAACIFEYHQDHIELLRVNQKFPAILGDGSLTVEDTLKLDWLQIMAPESRELLRQTLFLSRASRDEYTNEYILSGLPHKTHLRVTLRVIAIAGERLLVYSTNENITAQREAEEAQRSLLDNLPCGVGVYEFEAGQMDLAYQNKSYWELVGLYKADFPDPTPMSAVHPDDIPVIMQELTAAIGQGRDVACAIRLRHLTLGYRSVHLLGRVMPKEDGRFLIYATFIPTDAPS